MVPPLADTGEVGSTFEDIVEILHISCPYDSDIWFRYVGCDSLHGAEPGGVPPPVEIRLTDPPPQHHIYGIWNHTPLEESIREVGF